MSIKRCSKCEAAFECCSDRPGCWCEQVFVDANTLQELKKNYNNCLCSRCLREYTPGQQKK